MLLYLVHRPEIDEYISIAGFGGDVGTVQDIPRLDVIMHISRLMENFNGITQFACESDALVVVFERPKIKRFQPFHHIEGKSIPNAVATIGRKRRPGRSIQTPLRHIVHFLQTRNLVLEALSVLLPKLCHLSFIQLHCAQLLPARFLHEFDGHRNSRTIEVGLVDNSKAPLHALAAIEEKHLSVIGLDIVHHFVSS